MEISGKNVEFVISIYTLDYKNKIIQHIFLSSPLKNSSINKLHSLYEWY